MVRWRRRGGSLRRGAALAAAAAALCAGRAGASAPREAAVRYGRDIRPILSDRCFQCHGPDAGKRQADLRLDVPESAAADRGGYAAIVPGDPARSELWRRVTSADPDETMPRPEAGKRPLSAREKDLVRRWIEEGAVYEPHWSFVPPQRAALPEVRRAGWCRTPIDRFVLARLEREGVEPSPEAGPETLLRRLFLDVTGLPPTPQEIDEFLADARADAYERRVQSLLSQEPYLTRSAERLAAAWLDAARYADTSGIHTDAGRQTWLWRDWVLRAYRDNMPFDRFVTEQLAGDLLPGATPDQKVATGFNRNHVTTDEGGAIPEEYLVEYAADRAVTTSAVLLGLTMGCARCHDHKYDPFTQEDFYGLFAFFNSVDEPGLYSQLPDANRAFEPFLVVPTAEQEQAARRIDEELDLVTARLGETTPGEELERRAFLESLPARMGLAWAEAQVTGASSSGGATLTPLPDGSVAASGANPDDDDHQITLVTSATGLRLLLVEALPSPRADSGGGGGGGAAAEGPIGRAENGNAVLTGVEIEEVSLQDPALRRPVRLAWAWADHAQGDGEFAAANVLDAADARGWAVDAHRRPGGRALLLLSEGPFGFEGGTELRVVLRHRSIYKRHALSRVRLSVGGLGPEGIEALPVTSGNWYVVGPFPAASGEEAYDRAFGPEGEAYLDLARNFGFGNQYWRYDAALADERLVPLADGVNASYVGRVLYSPSAREVGVALGSDDGFRLYVNGAEVAGRRVDRSLAADQDRLTVRLEGGANAIVLRIANTGGQAGFSWRSPPRDGEFARDLVAAFLPQAGLAPPLRDRLTVAWRAAFLPSYRENAARLEELRAERAALDAAMPRTMVMRELAEPRATFVLARGRYDRPDRERPVARAVPRALGSLPEGAPRDRLGLAQWMTSPENPLVARVAVNRLWEVFFGTGLVRTSEDFGLQGEWPSHPELLDWLAVEFRESGWDLHHLIGLIVTSAVYRQDSAGRPELRERDPDNGMLASFPRRRLSAEQIRDLALYVSGLLVERAGGPSVRPYHPEGLWQEVSMAQSNTREYRRGEGADLWRRSIYTYWKRAFPPPSMQAFDAPTRESCVIRRASTNTPLQALVLWNDEQFVEAARVLAQRTLAEPGDDAARLSRMFRRCTGRTPESDEVTLLEAALGDFRGRYVAAPEDAAALLEAGEAPPPEGAEPPETAAWTLVASALLSLHETVTQD